MSLKDKKVGEKVVVAGVTYEKVAKNFWKSVRCEMFESSLEELMLKTDKNVGFKQDKPKKVVEKEQKIEGTIVDINVSEDKEAEEDRY